MKQFLKIDKQILTISIDIIVLLIGVFGLIGGLVQALLFPEKAMYGVYVLMVIAVVFYLGKRYENQDIISFQKAYGLFVFSTVAVYFQYVYMLILVLNDVVVNNYFLEFKLVFEKAGINDEFFPILFVVIACFPLVMMMVDIIVYKKKTLSKLLIVILFFLFPPFIRHELSSLTSYCLIFYVIYAYVFSYCLRTQNPISLKLVLLPLIAISLFVSSVILEPNPLFYQKTSKVLSHMSQWIHGDVVDDLVGGNSISGTSSTVSGKLPTTDIKLNDTIALYIQSTVPFSSYIRGYSLADYHENEWHPVQNEPLTDMQSSRMIVNHFTELGLSFFTANVKIDSVKTIPYQFVPYFPAFTKSFLHDSYYESMDESFNIYTQEPFFAEDLSFNYPTFSEYDMFVKDEYLSVPSPLKEKLIQFIFEKQPVDLFQDESDSLTRYDKADILYQILAYETSYDLKTGDLPEGADFVDYFLFNSKKGSCSHYASTLTLLLRCVGIPARYTRGYAVSKSDFDDQNTATILSNRSHAWVEIYYDGYGWLPFESTPINRRNMNVDEVASRLDQLLTTQDTNNQITNKPSQTIPQEKPDIPKQDEIIEKVWYENYLEYIPYVLMTLGAFILLALYRFISKRRFAFSLRHQTINQQVISYYQQMKKIQRFGGQIDEQVIYLAKKAKFSQHTITNEEIKQVELLYDNYRNNLYQTLPWYKKFVFQFVLGYK